MENNENNGNINVFDMISSYRDMNNGKLSEEYIGAFSTSKVLENVFAQLVNES